MGGQPRRNEEKQGMILVDTSVWIDFLTGANSRGRHTLHRLIEEEEDISITEIILTEVLQGIKEDKEFIAVRDSLMEFPIHATKGIETYLKAAGIYRDCRKKGKTIRKTVDCVIAAICIEYNLILFHNDSDFDRIRECTGLKVLRA